MIIQIQIANEVPEGIVAPRRLNEDVLLPCALVSVDKNKQAICTAINTSENEITLEQPKITLELIESHNNNSINFVSTTNANNEQSREELLLENLRIQYLNQEEKNSLLNICKEFKHIFHLPGDNLTFTPTMKHEINVRDPKPIFSKLYRYPKIYEQEVNKQITKMLDQNVIRPSISPWSSQVWVVPKKLEASGERKWRVVIDYRKLNDVTIGDAYPLPNIENILD